jgi:hypothetical protein
MDTQTVSWKEAIYYQSLENVQRKCEESLQFEPNDNPLFWALNAQKKKIVELLITYNLHTMCEINSLYVLAIIFNYKFLIEFTVESGADVNFVPMREFVETYVNDKGNYGYYFKDNNYDSYIMYNITKINTPAPLWGLLPERKFEMKFDLNYLIKHGINLNVGNFSYLRYELKNSEFSGMLDIILDHSDIPKDILNEFFIEAMEYGQGKYARRILPLIHPLTDSMAKDIVTKWAEWADPQVCMNVTGFYNTMNTNLGFFIDNLYGICSASTRSLFADVMQKTFVLIINGYQHLFNAELFEKLFDIGIELRPYLKHLILLGFYTSNFEVIKFVRTHYDVAAILKEVEEDIYRIQ